MSQLTIENRKAALRVSELPFPETPWKQLKYHFWKIIYPIHPYLRDFFFVYAVRSFLIAAKVLHHNGRQNFLLGKVTPGRDIKKFLSHLESIGFGNHFIAWEDNDEVISLRRPDGFERQYHLRIFKDGEVRGHYEYTPECHPIWHSLKREQERRLEHFKYFLGDWMVPEKIS